MDAFESLVSMLLKRDGYWTTTSFKVVLTKEQKLAINNPTAPRWEIDIVAYKGSTNEILAVECKSFLDSTGVRFVKGAFEPDHRYKLFCNRTTRTVVLRALKRQLVKSGACAKRPKVTLCLAAGRIAGVTDRALLKRHFDKHRWRLFDEEWIRSRLTLASQAGYENDVAHVVAKLLVRKNANRNA